MSILDPILRPLLQISPVFAVVFISLCVSFLVTIVYKHFTDQTLMKSLKEDLKSLQQKMRDNRDNPDKLMAIQKEAMDKNMVYMKHSLRPSLITLIPIIFLFGWITSTAAFVTPIADVPFEVSALTARPSEVSLQVIPANNISIVNATKQTQRTGWFLFRSNRASFTLQGPEGFYDVRFTANNETVSHTMYIGEDSYTVPRKAYVGFFRRDSSVFVATEVASRWTVRVLFMNLGAIGVYIFTSIFGSVFFRKIFKVS